MASTKLSQECDEAFIGLPKEVRFWLNTKSMRTKTSNNVTIGKIVMSDYREYLEDSKYSIVSFSGGKDSTCMLLMMLERNMKVDYILFCDTGMEFPQMYEHIAKVEKYISERYGKHITTIQGKHSFEYYAYQHEKTKGANKGTHGYGWSGMMNRWCTKELKIRPVQEFFRDHGLNASNTKQYIGIAADEPKRVKDAIYPLFEWGITEADALRFCYNHGFDWGGLYENHTRLSCWCCPLMNTNDMRVLYRDYPDMWNRLKQLNSKIMEVSAMEHTNFYEFKQRDADGRTLSQWEEKFKKELNSEQELMNLFE